MEPFTKEELEKKLHKLESGDYAGVVVVATTLAFKANRMKQHFPCVSFVTNHLWGVGADNKWQVITLP